MALISTPFPHPKLGTNDRTMSDMLRKIDQATRQRIAYRNAKIEPRWRPRYLINEQEASTPLLATAAPAPAPAWLGLDADWVKRDHIDVAHEGSMTGLSLKEDWNAPAQANGLPNSLDFIRKRYRRNVEVEERDVEDEEMTLIDSSEEEGDDDPEHTFDIPINEIPSDDGSMQSFSTVATADIGPLMESPSPGDSIAGSYGSEESSLCSSDWLFHPSSCDSDCGGNE